jgi:hypothetical protein
MAWLRLLLAVLPIGALVVTAAALCLAYRRSRPGSAGRGLAAAGLVLLGLLWTLVLVLCVAWLALAAGRSLSGRPASGWRRGRYSRPPGGGRPGGCPTVRELQMSEGANLEITNGWQPVHGKLRQVQSFVAPGGRVAAVNFRAARTLELPWGSLEVAVREAGGGRVLGSWKLADYMDGTGGVTRFFRPYTARLGDLGLRKGRTYEIVFSSPDSGANGPWLVNCFYRDTYEGGRQHAERGGRAERSGELDLAFQLAAADGSVLASSVPEGTDMGRRQHHGPSYARVREEIARRRQPKVDESPRTVSSGFEPPTEWPRPAPQMSREAAVRRAEGRGKLTLRRVDPCDRHLLWLGAAGKFLTVHDARDGALTDFDEFLRLVGKREVSVRQLAFDADRVWAATDRGALVYDRRTRYWSQLAVNLDASLLEADVTGVRRDDGRVVFTLADGRRYELDPEANSWRGR